MAPLRGGRPQRGRVGRRGESSMGRASRALHVGNRNGVGEVVGGVWIAHGGRGRVWREWGTR